MGTMHPTGFPAYVLVGWLASVVLQPLGDAAFRMNLLSALLVAAAVGLTVLLLRRLDVPLPVAVAGALGLALTPIVWSIRGAADAHALHLRSRRAPRRSLLALGAPRDAGGTRARRPAPRGGRTAGRAGRRAVRGGAGQPRPHVLLIPAVGLYVLAVDPRVLRRPRLVARRAGDLLRRAALLYLELPLRAGPFPAPLVYGHPETWSGFWDIVLARQFQGDIAGRSRTSPAKAVPRPVRVRPARPPRAPRAAGVPRDRPPPPAVRAAVRASRC